MDIIANILGFFFLVVTAISISSVESIELGEYASRFIATLLAVFAYFGLVSIGGIAPNLPAIKFELLDYLILFFGVSGILHFGYKIYENWNTETETVMKGGGVVAFVVVFAILARFLLAQ
jgi:hypothetical protein